MTRVLIYGNRKQDNIIWDVSTPALEEQALRELFAYLRDEWHVYQELEEPLQPLASRCTHACHDHHPEPEDRAAIRGSSYRAHLAQREAYAKAKTGDMAMIRMLLKLRKAYEYEQWRIEEVRGLVAR